MSPLVFSIFIHKCTSFMKPCHTVEPVGLILLIKSIPTELGLDLT